MERKGGRGRVGELLPFPNHNLFYGRQFLRMRGNTQKERVDKTCFVHALFLFFNNANVTLHSFRLQSDIVNIEQGPFGNQPMLMSVYASFLTFLSMFCWRIYRMFAMFLQAFKEAETPDTEGN